MKHFALFSSLLLALSSAHAEPPVASKKPGQSKIVCATENVTGSRLGGRKRCMTVQDWAETKRLDRQAVERLQANRYNGNESEGTAIRGDLGRNN